MAFLETIQNGIQTAGIQTVTFFQESSRIWMNGSDKFKEDLSLPDEVEKAVNILKSFLEDPDQSNSALNSIPKDVIQKARGLVILSVAKAGFVISGQAGSGLVVARLPDGSWSAPSCIGTAGVGWGLQAGADITDFVIILNSEEAVRAFSLGGNVTIGGSITAAAGSIGTGGSVQASLAHPAHMFSYSKSKGLFAGVSLEGTMLLERKDANCEFYGLPVPAKDILSGCVPSPKIASELYEIIEVMEGGFTEESYNPRNTCSHVIFEADGDY